MADKPKYYITTAIAYTSGKPHIGNTYEIVLADAIARYKRSQGYDVFFQTGTDEHGQKIELKAEEAGVTPKEFVDNVSGEIKRIWDLMNTSYDKFIRTTDDYHEKEVQKIFKKLYDQGDIYKGHYEGMYCTPCESFFTESQLCSFWYGSKQSVIGWSSHQLFHYNPFLRLIAVIPHRILFLLQLFSR